MPDNAEDTRQEEQPADTGGDKSQSELHLLDPPRVEFRREDGRLQMLEGANDWLEVSLARLFPLTEPEKWICVLDKEGKELGILHELKGLSHESLRLVREELSRRYLVPEIRRIVACRSRADLVEWTIETDRGQITMLTRNLRDNVQRPFPTRLALTDVEGNRYDIPDLELLDPVSRRLLEERL